MSWRCRLLPAHPGAAMQPGDMWYWPLAPFLSAQYDRDHRGKRPPLMVCLPNRVVFCVDRVADDPETNATRDGWTVTGEPPNITVSPSIDHPGGYHGWIRDGVITDDCEGRRFG
jgi:hypothetical protein